MSTYLVPPVGRCDDIHDSAWSIPSIRTRRRSKNVVRRRCLQRTSE